MGAQGRAEVGRQMEIMKTQYLGLNGDKGNWGDLSIHFGVSLCRMVEL